MNRSTGIGFLPEVEQRGVTPADTEHEAPARRLLHGRGDIRERSRMARVRVGHAGRETQPVGGGGRQRDGDERVTDQVLRVGEGDAVPAEMLGPLRLGDHGPDLGNPHRPQLHTQKYRARAALGARGAYFDLKPAGRLAG